MAHLPFTRPTDFLREREFGRKIEASFDFIRAHFRPLGKCLVYIVLPLLLLQGIAGGLLQARMGGVLHTWQTMMARGGAGNQAESLQRLSNLVSGPEYWVAILGSLFSYTLLILTVYGYVVLRLEKQDPLEPVTVQEVWAVVKRRFAGTLASFFGLVFFVILGALAVGIVIGFATSMLRGNLFMVFLMGFTVYGVISYAMVALSLFFIIQLRERKGFFATIGRCFSLVWGKWWSTFGLIFIMMLLVGVLAIVVLSITTLISSPFAATPEQAQTALGRVMSVVAACLNSVSMMALYPLLFLALAFQYFNLVERKEGQGLHALVGTIGAQPEVAPASHAYQPDDEGEY
ncbi:hypothetical protein PK28_13755 [Hymenobacter sp. DG25B]|uniref:hypothetical protein n=1 Tax=Hymenobacter sp. DG25B TaxID=1385664 RepID=UPI000540F467|nr:hypothetical protein [Hymenobacter sp. DG25B]AIZ64473.1 hypothetical protein PK28_13755 [Hymenobacter sp. DG25B]